MPITDPEAIRLTNEIIRPLAERMRNLIAELEAAQEMVDRIMPTIPADSTIVEDGREAEGVSVLTGLDIHGLVEIRGAILLLATPQARALVSKASVRPMRIT